MSLESREASPVRAGFFFLDGSSVQPTERIKASELQTTVIAKQFMQTGNPQDNQRIVVATLNSDTLTSRAPHSADNLTNLMAFEFNNFLSAEKSAEFRKKTVKSPAKQRKSPPNGVFGGLRLIIPAASYSPTQLPAQYHRLQEA
jgi:hypothetical protein